MGVEALQCHKRINLSLFEAAVHSLTFVSSDTALFFQSFRRGLTLPQSNSAVLCDIIGNVSSFRRIKLCRSLKL